MTDQYFTLFEQPVSLQPDLVAIQRQFIQLQRQFHPDFFAQGSSMEQEDALEKTATLNEALKTLKDPQRRLAYILTLHGHLQPEEKFNLPPDFLMEVMDWSEGDPAEAKAAATTMEKELDGELGEIAARYHFATASPEDLHALKLIYFKKKYLHRLLANTTD